MNQIFEQIFDKYDLVDDLKEALAKEIDEEILRVFRRLSVQQADVKNKTTAKSSAVKAKTKSSDDICAGKKANGEDCTFKAKENGYCGRHDPDKESSKKSSKLKTKKNTHECHAIMPKTKKGCPASGTVNPTGSEHWYCKRHSVKWTEFEEEVDAELKGSDEEEPDLEVADDDDE